MRSNNLFFKPSYFFIINNKLELDLKRYIESKGKQEISGSLIGDIIGGKSNEINFVIKSFLPFPNLAQNKYLYFEPPEIWFKILEEWRLFYFHKYKFIGFLHTHFDGSSRISKIDKKFVTFLGEVYGTIIFIIISENDNLRCYLRNEKSLRLINGKVEYYKLITKS